ncbi:MAG TPA: hypothetical protein VMH85_14365 [Terriglobales bacterium]|nr:hypothetical protein [Terriglobales bacterium]
MSAFHGWFRSGVTVLVLLLSWLAVLGTHVPQLPSRESPELITVPEAEILIYFLPQAVELRHEGVEVGWELDRSPKFNQQDFFCFWVMDVTRKVEGSVTVGWFFVNRHTADVWDDGLEKYVLSRDLEGIQKILRQAHRIDEETLRIYRMRSPNVPGEPKN